MIRNFLQVKTVGLIKLLPPRIINRQVFIATLPLTVAATIFIIPLEINRPIEYLYWALIGLLAHLAMLPLAIYSLEQSSLLEQSLLLLAMGLVRGAAIGILAPIFGLEDQFSLPLRALNSMLFIFYIFQIFAIVYDFRYGFQKKVSALIKQSVLKKQTMDLTSPFEPNNELMVVIGNLQEKIRLAMSEMPKSQSIKESTQEIDDIVRDYIRPLSQSKWSNGDVSWMKLGFFRVIKRSLSLAPLPAFEVYLLMLPLALVNQVSRLGFTTTFITQSAFFLAFILLVIGSRILLPLKNGSFFAQNASIIFISSLVVTPLFAFVVGISPGTLINAQSGLIKHLYPPLLIAAVLITASLLSILNNDKALALDYLENSLDKDKTKNFYESSRQSIRDANYAQYLHAEVQSKLLVCKLLLLKAAESDFQIFSPEVTNQILARLDGLGKQPATPVSQVPSQRVNALVQSWKGLAEISFDLSPDFDEIKAEANAVSQLIEEAVINAIRHGHAKKVYIHAFFLSGLLKVVIHDDGVYVENKKPDGLGSILFDTFAKRWDIASDGDGTTLRFSVEIASSHTASE
jgi:signal transduction histidine kinase